MPPEEGLQSAVELTDPQDVTSTLTEEDVNKILAGEDTAEEEPEQPEEKPLMVNGAQFKDIAHLEQGVKEILAENRAKDAQIQQLLGQLSSQKPAERQPRAEDTDLFAPHVAAITKAANSGPDDFIRALLQSSVGLLAQRIPDIVTSHMDKELMPVLRPALARQQLLGNTNIADVHPDVNEITYLVDRGLPMEEAVNLVRHLKQKGAPAQPAAPTADVVKMPQRKRPALESAGSGVTGKTSKQSGKNFLDQMIESILNA